MEEAGASDGKPEEDSAVRMTEAARSSMNTTAAVKEVRNGQEEQHTDTRIWADSWQN